MQEKVISGYVSEMFPNVYVSVSSEFIEHYELTRCLNEFGIVVNAGKTAQELVLHYNSLQMLIDALQVLQYHGFVLDVKKQVETTMLMEFALSQFRGKNI